MNQADRDAVSKIVEELEHLKGQIENLGGQLRDMADAEQEKFDNMTEGLQASEQGQKIEAAAEQLGEAADAADSGNAGEAIDALEQMEL